MQFSVSTRPHQTFPTINTGLDTGLTADFAAVYTANACQIVQAHQQSSRLHAEQSSRLNLMLQVYICFVSLAHQFRLRNIRR